MSESQVPQIIQPTDPPVSKTKREFYPVLDGVRVLLTLWVVLFHTAWHVAMFMPREPFEKWFSTTPSLVSSGLNGVDWFFVLTGFLLAQPIFAGQRTGTWFEFVWLRLSRIYPLYIFAIVLFCAGMSKMDTIPTVTWEQHSTEVLRPIVGQDSLGIPTLCDKTWVNLLFLNNFLPFGGCMGWTWSLAIQAHFIFIFPLILKWFGMGKNFLYFCGIMTAVWMGLRWFLLVAVVQKYPTDPPPLYIYSSDYIEQFFILFNVWYSSTIQRIGCCFAGVILAWVQVFKPKWAEMIKNNTFAPWIIISIAIYCLQFTFNVHFFNTIPTFFFSVGGIGHLIAISTILYCLINKIGPAKFIEPILSHSFFKKLAYPSYCVYLIHSYMIIWIMRTDGFTPDSNYNDLSLIKDFGIVLGLVYPISYLATRFIEEPIKGFMRDYIDPRQSTTVNTTTTTATTDATTPDSIPVSDKKQQHHEEKTTSQKKIQKQKGVKID